MNMEDKLENTINKIVRLCAQNPGFDRELRRRLGMVTLARGAAIDKPIRDDVHAIREALEIRGDNSISYDFISNRGYKRLRDQLILDNLRMENAAMNLKDKEKERFYVFCVNAFYQIENVVNYYFYVMFPKIDDLLDCIERCTSLDGRYGFRRMPNREYRTVSDIEIKHKLDAICNILFPGEKIKITYSQLRQVRNEGAHRCMIIMEGHDESNALYKFFRNNTFNSIRIALIKLVSAVRQAVENADRGIVVRKGIITSVLPSVSFVNIDGTPMQIPSAMLRNVSKRTAGSPVEIQMKNMTIVDIVDVKI